MGDVYDSVSLETLIRGNDAVISAFNPGWKDPNLYQDQVRGTTSIIAAIKKAGVKRVLWMGGAGGLEVKPGVRVIDNPRHARMGEARFIGNHQRAGATTERTGA